MSSGYFLVFHGSRDRRGQFILSQLIHSLSQQVTDKLILAQGKHLQQKSELEIHHNICNYTGEYSSCNTEGLTILSEKKTPLIGTGSLELTTIPLHHKIQQYADSIQKLGYKGLKILPLFLTPGVHVCEDIPAEIEQIIVSANINLELLPFLGTHARISTILSRQFTQLPSDGRILLAHGTKYPQGNAFIDKLATQVNARVAYYSVASSLQAQVQALVAQKVTRIAIIPYFLFPGRITEAIAIEIAQLQQDFPETELLLGRPLGTTGELSNLIFEVLAQ